jgi:hypothetical protein
MHYQRLANTGTTDPRMYPTECEADGCSGRVKSRGLCIKHYTRLIRTGATSTGVIIGDDKKRLKANSVETDSGCWEWQRSIKLGYGVTFLNGKHEQAHRASYKLFVGEIPEGLQINHKCHNRACINPDHLYAGTQTENMEDMRRAGRGNKCKGEDNPSSKLKNGEVSEIKVLIRNGVTSVEIAKKFDVSEGCINFIKTGKSWRHVA